MPLVLLVEKTYLVPNANVALVPLISSLDIGALGDVVAEELEHVLALLVAETLDVSHALGVNVERFVSSGLSRLVNV